MDSGERRQTLTANVAVTAPNPVSGSLTGRDNVWEGGKRTPFPAIVRSSSDLLSISSGPNFVGSGSTISSVIFSSKLFSSWRSSAILTFSSSFLLSFPSHPAWAKTAADGHVIIMKQMLMKTSTNKQNPTLQDVLCLIPNFAASTVNPSLAKIAMIFAIIPTLIVFAFDIFRTCASCSSTTKSPL